MHYIFKKMEDIFTPAEFFEFMNSGLIETEIESELLILFNPFDTQSLTIIENIISQLRDVFF